MELDCYKLGRKNEIWNRNPSISDKRISSFVQLEVILYTLCFFLSFFSPLSFPLCIYSDKVNSLYGVLCSYPFILKNQPSVGLQSFLCYLWDIILPFFFLSVVCMHPNNRWYVCSNSSMGQQAVIHQ